MQTYQLESFSLDDMLVKFQYTLDKGWKEQSLFKYLNPSG
jgi:hypothetical protein